MKHRSHAKSCRPWVAFGLMSLSTVLVGCGSAQSGLTGSVAAVNPVSADWLRQHGDPAQAQASAAASVHAAAADAAQLEDVRRSAVAATSAVIELQRERLAQGTALHRALGGGWDQTQPAAARP